ncbi:MAG TPA: hypothetical protein VJ672_02255 [Gemmatimonadaceae bacterium]|nr:hypothetical protein [Gemmatimonadaceae bacterium]
MTPVSAGAGEGVRRARDQESARVITAPNGTSERGNVDAERAPRAVGTGELRGELLRARRWRIRRGLSAHGK